MANPELVGTIDLNGSEPDWPLRAVLVNRPYLTKLPGRGNLI